MQKRHKLNAGFAINKNTIVILQLLLFRNATETIGDKSTHIDVRAHTDKH